MSCQPRLRWLLLPFVRHAHPRSREGGAQRFLLLVWLFRYYNFTSVSTYSSSYSEKRITLKNVGILSCSLNSLFLWNTCQQKLAALGIIFLPLASSFRSPNLNVNYFSVQPHIRCLHFTDFFFVPFLFLLLNSHFVFLGPNWQSYHVPVSVNKHWSGVSKRKALQEQTSKLLTPFAVYSVVFCVLSCFHRWLFMWCATLW